MKWTGKKFIANMITTAINILATFLLVFNWLSRLRLIVVHGVGPVEDDPTWVGVAEHCVDDRFEESKK